MTNFNQYIQDVKTAAWDLHDVASKLGLQKGKGQTGENCLYHSPHHGDKNPSLSVFKKNGEYAWCDHSNNSIGGDAIALVTYVTDKDFKEAIKTLAAYYQVPDIETIQIPRVEKTRAAFIADAVLKTDFQKAKDYLMERGITEDVITLAQRYRAIGLNNWTSPSKVIGTVGFGGEGVAFIVRDYYSQQPIAVDTRYFHPDMNGGVKTNSQGDKADAPWVIDWSLFKKAHTVIIVESSINALSVHSAMKTGFIALALRGTANAKTISEHLFEEKRVIIAMDNDAPFGDEHKLAGQRAGAMASWILYERLSTAGVATQIVDMSDWELGWDVNDYLVKQGANGLKNALLTLENHAIAGLPANNIQGKPRFYLPSHDYEQYWRYQVHADFTRFVAKYSYEEDERKPIQFDDLAAFRIAQVGRVAIQSWQATVLDAADGTSELMFAVSAQTAQHGHTLKRITMTDEQYASPAAWNKFGYIYKPAEFMRLTSILTRTLDGSQQQAVNFVGLCYKDGKPHINNGADCYFGNPAWQCPYHGLVFHSGSRDQALQIIHAYQATFRNNVATLALVWALGAHLKLFLGFYPHMQMSADKGSGKSTLMDALARTLQMQVFGADMLKTGFRLQHSVSYTGHPVMWEEIGTNRKEVIKEGDDKLQEAYNYRQSLRGQLSYLSAAPVLLGGEEVDMNSLIGKLTRTSIKASLQSTPISGTLPIFPMRQWLEYLARLDRETVETSLNDAHESCLRMSAASEGDANARRMVRNFAAIRLAWHYLCDFAGIPVSTGNFETDLITEMNAFVTETKASRQPWVWIVDIIFSEIDARRYPFPVMYDQITKEGKTVDVLLIRHTQMMDHINHSTHLRSRSDTLPIRQAKTLRSQMLNAEVIFDEGRERRQNGLRVTGLMALNLEMLKQYGLTLARELVTDKDDYLGGKAA